MGQPVDAADVPKFELAVSSSHFVASNVGHVHGHKLLSKLELGQWKQNGMSRKRVKEARTPVVGPHPESELE